MNNKRFPHNRSTLVKIYFQTQLQSDGRLQWQYKNQTPHQLAVPVVCWVVGQTGFSLIWPMAKCNDLFCRQPYGLHHRSPPSDENWKHFLFTPVFGTTSHQFTVSSYVLCRYLIDCVKCPCSVLRDSVT